MREYKNFLLVISGVLLLTYFPFINSQDFCFDDYFLFFNPPEGQRTVDFSIQSGRWFGIFIYSMLSKLIGVGGFKGILFSYFSVLAQFLFVAVILAKAFKLDTTKINIGLLFSLGFVHLFNAEIMTFKYGLLVNAGFSFIYLFAFGGWYLLTRKKIHFLFGMLCIVLALASYQVVLNQLIVVSLLLVFFDFVGSISKNEKLNFSFFKNSDGFIKMLGVLISVVLYVLINKVVIYFTGVGESTRSAFIGVSDLPERIKQVGALYQSVLFSKSEYLIPFATKMLTLGLIGLGIFVLIQKSLSVKADIKNKIFAPLFILVFSVLILVSSNFISLLIKEWWPVPRMLTGFGFAIMGFGLMVYKFSNKKYLLNATLVLTLFLLFSHVNINHSIASDQSYRNLTDRNKALMIMSQVAQIEDFKNKKVYIHQNENCWVDEVNIQNKFGDLNLSSFCTSWSKYQLLEFVSGIPLQKTTEEENKELAEIIKNAPEIYKRWPEKGSVISLDEYIIIHP